MLRIKTEEEQEGQTQRELKFQMVKTGDQKLYEEKNTSAGIKERQIDSTLREVRWRSRGGIILKLKYLLNDSIPQRQ